MFCGGGAVAGAGAGRAAVLGKAAMAPEPNLPRGLVGVAFHGKLLPPPTEKLLFTAFVWFGVALVVGGVALVLRAQVRNTNTALRAVITPCCTPGSRLGRWAMLRTNTACRRNCTAFRQGQSRRIATTDTSSTFPLAEKTHCTLAPASGFWPRTNTACIRNCPASRHGQRRRINTANTSFKFPFSEKTHCPAFQQP